MSIDYVAETMVTTKTGKTEIYEMSSFIVIILPIVASKGISDQSYGIYLSSI